MDNWKIMDMIIDEFEKWKGAHPGATFKSMKVIMCTPRSIGYGIQYIRETVQECYDMKTDKGLKYRDWIAGKWNHLAQKQKGANVSHPSRTKTKPEWD